MHPVSISEEEVKERDGKEQADHIPGREENNCVKPQTWFILQERS